MANDDHEHHREQPVPVVEPAAPVVDVEAVIARVRAACQAQPRRYTLPLDIDHLVVTSVNVPFPTSIDAETLAGILRGDAVPPAYAPHLERFLGEMSLTNILRFCDRHHIDAAMLARFVRAQRGGLALYRPDLEEHLDALVPGR